MYLTKKELLFLTFLLDSWGEAGFNDSEMWNALTPDQLDKIQWLFDGKDSFELKLKEAGYTQEKVIDEMDLSEDIKDYLR